MHLLEWMSGVGLLYSGHDLLVEDEGHADGEERESDVGEDREKREAGERDEQHEQTAEHDARLARVLPCQQVNYCKQANKWSVSAAGVHRTTA